MTIIWCMVPKISSVTQNFLSLWTIFCTFTPITNQKIKILKKWKKQVDISFYTSAPQIMIICYTVTEIWCVMDVIVIFHCGLFFALLPHFLTAQKIKISKNEKSPWRYHFTHVYHELWLDNIWLLQYGVPWTDRQKDGRMEKVTYRSGCST